MAENARQVRLRKIVLGDHLVTEEEFAECVGQSNRTGVGILSLLIEKGYVDEEDFAAAFCEEMGIPHIRVGKRPANKAAIEKVPETLARRYEVLPVSIEDDVLTVAVAEPLGLMRADDLTRGSGLDIREVVAVRSELLLAIDKRYSHRNERENETEESEPESDSDDADIEEVDVLTEVEDLTVEKTGAEEEPVKKLVRRILRDALKLGASDIHIEPCENVISLRYRIDGTLQDAKRPPKKLQPKMIARLKILTDCRIDVTRLPQDGRLRIRYENRDIDFRVGFLPCHYGEKIVLRILDKGSLTLDLDTLGFEPQPMEAFRNALAQPNGMLLVSGPTGSGKTTTLYSALHKLNTRGVNIVTVEDPIEYELFGINQVQVHSDIGLTFANVLREILRQDPNIVMVGEIRDRETADVAVKAALTGHLVLSTLHTNDSAAVYPRLIDMGVEPFLVQSSVMLASAQRLFKKVCEKCKESLDVPEEVLRRIQYVRLPNEPEPSFVRGRGCAACKQGGHKGRVAVIEAMPNYPEIARLILNKAPGIEIKNQAVKCGMRTLRQNGLSKAARGITSLEQVLEHTVEDQFLAPS